MPSQRATDRQRAAWLPAPAWAARALDLREVSTGRPLPQDWEPNQSSFIASLVADLGTPTITFHHVEGATTRTGHTMAHTIVVTLHSGTAPTDDPTDTIALVLTATTMNDAWTVLAEHGLDLRRADTPTATARISGIHAALSDPDSWFPGLAAATGAEGSATRAALTSLLTVAHPRIRDHAAAAPVMGLIRDGIPAHEIATWLNTDLTVPDIAVLVEVFDDPTEAQPWVEAFPDATSAAYWRHNGPGGDPTGLARLHVAGWDTRLACDAVRTLRARHRHEPGSEAVATAIAYTELSLTPDQACTLIRAGVSVQEITALIERTPNEVAGLDWDTFEVMGALQTRT